MSKISIFTNLNPNIIPSIVNFNKLGYFLDGDNIPKYFNENGSWDWMHKDPTTAITTVESGAGSMDGIYKYMYTEAHLASGEDEYSCHETNPSPIYATGTLASKKVVLTLPAAGVNGFTDYLFIYGTDPGSLIYYRIGKVAIGTTTFEDNNIARDANVAFGKLTEAADGITSQTYLNYPIKNHRYSVAMKSEMVVGGINQIDDGTVAVIDGSKTITGSSSLWTRAVVGDFFQKAGDTRRYEVGAWVSATEITLSDNYEGSTSSGSDYIIEGVDDMIRWSAKHPNTAKALPWSFPLDYWKRLKNKDVPKDGMPSMRGLNRIGDQVVVFKQRSHFLMTKSGDEYLEQESSTKVGTCSHWSVCETPGSGSLIFMTYEGLIYETRGLEAHDLGVDLSKTVDGINTARLKYVQAKFVANKNWYILLYSSKGSSAHDKMLVYDYGFKEWVTWDLKANCLAMIESDESGQTVFKPWMGSVGGFVYKMLTGNNFGAGTSNTLSGTITSIGSATLTDSVATFNATGDGHKDVYVSLYGTDDIFQEMQKISSNTSTVLTADTSWTSSPQTGWTYEIGSINWYWMSKVNAFDSDNAKSIETVLMNFKKVSSTRNVKVTFYFSEDPDMEGDSSNQSITFDLNLDYYIPLGLYDNRARYMQYKIEGHGNADPVQINNLILDIQEYLS
jgi:hypothetical protein